MGPPFCARKSAVVSEQFIDVCDLTDVQPGLAHIVALPDREVALFNVDGQLYAIDNDCPHAGGPLGDGWIKDCIVTCPWHAWSFDVRTGKMTLGDYSTVDCFDVRVEGTRVSVSATPRA
jgi:nitrite reductase (NADH) small subunit/3-phenylpropionate/trans-cinnamate dioxygenase ferredoxin subunit